MMSETACSWFHQAANGQYLHFKASTMSTLRFLRYGSSVTVMQYQQTIALIIMRHIEG
jgi:hypothetical protein